MVTVAPAIRAPWKATTHSGELGATMPTRSPGSIPSSCRERATPREASQTWAKVYSASVIPSTRAMRSGQASAAFSNSSLTASSGYGASDGRGDSWVMARIVGGGRAARRRCPLPSGSALPT